LSMHTQPMAIDQLIAFLHTTPLFARVEPAVVAEIAPELEHLQLDAGAIVIREAMLAMACIWLCAAGCGWLPTLRMARRCF